MSWLYFGREKTSLILALAAFLATVAGIVLAFASRRRQALKRSLEDMALVFWSLLIMSGLAEGVLRLRAHKDPLIRPPGEFYRLKVDLNVFPGASPFVHFTVNSLGLRGPAWPADNRAYKIVTVGGSTTENDFLDDGAEWPHLVMEEMNRAPEKRPVWVGNAGINGQTAVDHVILLRTLPLFTKVDAVLVLVGVNDLNASLAFGGGSTKKVLEENAENFRLSITGVALDVVRPFYRRLRIYQLVRSALPRLLRRSGATPNGVVVDINGQTKARAQYASLPVVALPDMDLAVAEYRSRVKALAAECHALRTRCIFLTQPSLWREDLGPAGVRLLCCSVVGHRATPSGWVTNGSQPLGRLALRDSAAAMLRYNNVLLETCAATGVECIDLAADVPRTPAMFYDDFHYTEAGARQVAGAIVKYLKSRPPFALPPGE